MQRRPSNRWTLLVCTLLIGGLLVGLHALGGIGSERWKIKREVTRAIDARGSFLVVMVYHGGNSASNLAAWRKMEQKHSRSGVKIHFILVVGSDASGDCADTQWAADIKFCDSEGHIGNVFSANPDRSEGFLWNWRGDLLLQQKSPRVLGRTIAEEIDQRLRIRVEVEPSNPRLRRRVQKALMDTGWVDVIPHEDVKDRLQGAKRRSRLTHVREEHRVALGEAAGPNAMLLVKRNRRESISLELYELRSETLIESLSESGLSSRRAGAATRKLLGQMKAKPKVPLHRNKPTTTVAVSDSGEWAVPTAIVQRQKERRRREAARRAAEAKRKRSRSHYTRKSKRHERRKAKRKRKAKPAVAAGCEEMRQCCRGLDKHVQIRHRPILHKMCSAKTKSIVRSAHSPYAATAACAQTRSRLRDVARANGLPAPLCE